jgi:DNA-binding CsgD family transcriptional regulator
MAPGTSPGDPSGDRRGRGDIRSFGPEDEVRPRARFVSVNLASPARPPASMIAGACGLVADAHALSSVDRDVWLGELSSRVVSMWGGGVMSASACVLAPAPGGRAEVEAAGRADGDGPGGTRPASEWASSIWPLIESGGDSGEAGEPGSAPIAWARVSAWGAWRALAVRLDASGGPAPTGASTVLRASAPALARAYAQRFIAPAERRAELLARLSPAQRRVAELLVEGNSERDIAQELGRSIHTIHDHAKAIYRAWGVKSRRELWERWV